MDSLKLFFLAFTQGITELLPISSSAHLILLGNIINLDIDNTLLTTLHIGTTLAIILFFRKEIFNKFLSKNNRGFFSKILIASIPAIIIGFFFEEYIVETLRAPWITSFSLILWGVVMIFLNGKKEEGKNDFTKITFKKSFLIGLTQTLSLVPGTSRSGITTISGVLLGLNKYLAFEFSLLLGIPVLLGASLWPIIKDIFTGSNQTSLIFTSTTNFVITILVPFVMGYISLCIVKNLQRKNWLKTFGIYRIVVGILIILLQYWP